MTVSLWDTISTGDGVGVPGGVRLTCAAGDALLEARVAAAGAEGV